MTIDDRMVTPPPHWFLKLPYILTSSRTTRVLKLEDVRREGAGYRFMLSDSINQAPRLSSAPRSWPLTPVSFR